MCCVYLLRNELIISFIYNKLFQRFWTKFFSFVNVYLRYVGKNISLQNWKHSKPNIDKLGMQRFVLFVLISRTTLHKNPTK